jgi:hypothetical protein
VTLFCGCFKLSNTTCFLSEWKDSINKWVHKQYLVNIRTDLVFYERCVTNTEQNINISEHTGAVWKNYALSSFYILSRMVWGIRKVSNCMLLDFVWQFTLWRFIPLTILFKKIHAHFSCLCILLYGARSVQASKYSFKWSLNFPSCLQSEGSLSFTSCHHWPLPVIRTDE